MRIRMRTSLRAGHVPGQPPEVVTAPKYIPSIPVIPQHVCGWCGGPNSHNNRTTYKWRVLCHKCMRDEFGSPWAYDHFMRSEIARARFRKGDGRL